MRPGRPRNLLVIQLQDVRYGSVVCSFSVNAMQSAVCFGNNLSVTLVRSVEMAECIVKIKV